MIERDMSTLERAIEIAASSHTGQVDKADKPYILHPLRVMLSVNSPEEKIAAVLHDVVEDTPWTFEQLLAEGFSEEIIEAVRALTKHKGESRIDAAHRAADNAIARQVKLADVCDNMDLSRISNPSQKDFDRLEEYKKVRAILQQRIKSASITHN